MGKTGRVHVGAAGGAGLLLAGLLLAAVWATQVHAPRVLVPVTPAAEPAPDAPALRPLQARQLRYERNQGQAPQDVHYLSRGPRHQLSVFDDGLALSAPAADGSPSSARLRFVDSQRGGRFEERESVTARAHYLHGADPARWIRGVQQVRQLRYAELYRGIDLVYYSRDGELEFDLVVKPGADPALIRLQASGAKAPFVDADGHLLLDGEGGVLRVHRPVLQQNIDGQRITLDARWVLDERGTLRFELPAYDKRYPLVIDPVFKLLYSTYVGGVHDDVVGGMVLDANGNAYVVGHSGSEDWPVSGNAVQTRRKNLGVYVRNVVVTKFDAAGTLIWSTFLGGSVNDYGRGIGLDARGRVVIAGQTLSSDFPTTANALQRQLQGNANAFVAVLSPDGSVLEYSSLHGGAGGSDATGLKIDPAGLVVIAGSAGPGLPTTAGAYQTALSDGSAAFVAKFDFTPGGSAQLVAGSYYGAALRPAGQNNDNLSYAVALDATGAPWLTGQAFTRSLPVTPDAVMAAPPSLTANCQSGSVPLNSAAYVAKLSADLRTLQYASYLTGRTGGPGTCSEFGRSVALDGAGNVYVAGSTASLAFPTTPGALQATSPANAGVNGFAGFVLKLAPDGRTLAWSTYLGGNGGNMFFSGIAADSGSNSVWVHGTTGGGTNFPLSADGLQRQFGGGTYDAAYHQFDAATGALKHGSFLGGAGNDDASALAIDGAGNVYVAGLTDSRNLAVTPNAFQPAYTAGAFDGNDWFLRIVGSGAIWRVQPSTLGIGGTATLTIAATGVDPAARVQLVGNGRVIEATAVAVDTIAGKVQGTLPLRDAVAGRYDLAILNPDGQVLRKTQAVTLAGDGRPEVSVVVVARPAVRTGVPQTYNFVVTNSGNADAYFSRLWITFPASMQHRIPGVAVDPDSPNLNLSDAAVSRHEFDDLKYLPLIVPLLRAGSSETFTLELTSTVDSAGLSVQAFTRPPWFDDRADALAALAAAEANPSSLSRVCQVPLGKGYLRNCLGEYLVDVTNQTVARLAAPVQETLTLPPPATLSVDPVLISTIQSRALTLLRESLLAQTDLSALGVPNHDRRRQILAGSRERPLAGPILLVIYAAGRWLLVGTAGWGLGKGLDTLIKPPVKDWTQDPRYVRSETIRGKCVAGLQPVTEHIYVQNPTGVLFKTHYDHCGKECPKSAGGAGGAGGANQSLARALGATSGEGFSSSLVRARPLAAGGTCPNPPPDECSTVGNPNNNGSGSGGGSCGSSGGAIDPNDKFGAAGDGSASHWLRQTMPLSYQIAFENLRTATLPAAEVVVADQLDAAKYDLTTLTLGSISWGPHRIDVPPGLNAYSTIYNIDTTVSVRVAGSLNPTTGVLKWTFTTLDPVTKLPPSDPTLGFLPPNVNGTQGQGYVNFTISPKAGLPDGTKWENSASIVFDTNAPIVTPTWVNTLDTMAPAGRVASAVQRSESTDVDVSWSATDAGAGARSYTVYVSDNGSAFTAWKTGVSVTSAVWAGTAGHVYAFHVIATDGAGNTEAAKSAAEASVTVRDPAGGGSSGEGGGGGGCTVGGPGQRDATLVLLALAALVLLRRRRVSAPPATRSRRTAPG